MELQSTSVSVNTGEYLNISSKESYHNQASPERYSSDIDTVSNNVSKSDSFNVLNNVHSECQNNATFHGLKEYSAELTDMGMRYYAKSSVSSARCEQVQTESSQSSLNFDDKVQKQICDSLLPESELLSSNLKVKPHSESNNIEDLSNSDDSFADHSAEKLSSSGGHTAPSCPNETTESPENQSDVRRTRRNGKRRLDCANHCPVCGVTIRLSELENHFSKEVENLAKINKGSKRQRREEITIKETLMEVKSNRENRLTAKVARYAARAKNEVQCPVCSLRMSGTQHEINRHVLNCIDQDKSSDDCITVDDDDESFEEYEFADQTRIRAISLVPGGYRTLHGHSTKQKTVEEEEDLNVDVDDTQTYGQPQYTELDIISNTSYDGEDKSLEMLRKAVLVDPTARPQVLESRKWSTHAAKQDEDCGEVNYGSGSQENSMEELNREACDENKKNLESNHVVFSLKEKIKDLEEQNKNVKCLICMEAYTKPVVSTTCWHVHCEECWLMTMGVKKLCPQCNMIVFPTDLRRIYL